MPAWVTDGFAEYARRFPKRLSLELIEVPLGLREKKDKSARAISEESRRMLKAVRSGDLVVALDQTGKTVSTEKLAGLLSDWQQDGRNVVFLIGGPDGLGCECLDRAEIVWSLSPLTFPHALVRILVAEQLYRAWTILQNHPYHRGCISGKRQAGSGKREAGSGTDAGTKEVTRNE